MRQAQGAGSLAAAIRDLERRVFAALLWAVMLVIALRQGLALAGTPLYTSALMARTSPLAMACSVLARTSARSALLRTGSM